jgi:hypothetical protein
LRTGNPKEFKRSALVALVQQGTARRETTQEILVLATGKFGIDIPDGTPRPIFGEELGLLRDIQNLLALLT